MGTVELLSPGEITRQLLCESTPINTIQSTFCFDDTVQLFCLISGASSNKRSTIERHHHHDSDKHKMASSAELQAQQDALIQELPVLSLDTAPRHLSCADVLAFVAKAAAAAAAAGGAAAASSSKAERQQAAQLVAKAAARITACEACDRHGQLSTSSHPNESGGTEDTTLRFAATTALHFAARRLRVQRGAFLCGRCHAASNPVALLQLAVPPLPGAEDEEGRCVSS